MTIAERIYALVQALPEERAAEVLTFVEFVQARMLGFREVRSPSEALPWVELVQSLAGTWEDNFPTLETIRADEGQDVLRENL